MKIKIKWKIIVCRELKQTDLEDKEKENKDKYLNTFRQSNNENCKAF